MIRLGAIGFDAVKQIVLARIEKRPARLDLAANPYLPQTSVRTTSAADYAVLVPMLRSTMKTVSAPAIRSLRGSLPHPTQPLYKLRVRRYRRLTQHSLPGGPLRHYLGRTCTG